MAHLLLKPLQLLNCFRFCEGSGPSETYGAGPCCTLGTPNPSIPVDAAAKEFKQHSPTASTCCCTTPVERHNWSEAELLDVMLVHVTPHLGQVDLLVLGMACKSFRTLVSCYVPPTRWSHLDTQRLQAQLWHRQLDRQALKRAARRACAQPLKHPDPLTTGRLALAVLRHVGPHLEALHLNTSCGGAEDEILTRACSQATSLRSLRIAVAAGPPAHTHPAACGGLLCPTPAAVPSCSWDVTQAAVRHAGPQLHTLELQLARPFVDTCELVALSGCGALEELSLDVISSRGGRRGGDGPIGASLLAQQVLDLPSRPQSLRQLVQLLASLGPGLKRLSLPLDVDVTDGIILHLLQRCPALELLYGSNAIIPIDFAYAEWPTAVRQEAERRGWGAARLLGLSAPAVQELQEVAVRNSCSSDGCSTASVCRTTVSGGGGASAAAAAGSSGSGIRWSAGSAGRRASASAAPLTPDQQRGVHIYDDSLSFLIPLILLMPTVFVV